MKVGVIDYGVGNLGSVLRSLEELRAVPALIDSPALIHQTDCLILPGVGNFTEGMKRLNESQWPEALHKSVEAGRPLFGICLGMQLLATMGTEGAIDTPSQPMAGLGMIKGTVKRLDKLGCTLRVPHMGWNSIHIKDRSSPLLDGIVDGTDFYFVHSYAFVPDSDDELLATTDYGVPVTAVVGKGHVWGAQFHPEKSSSAGHKVLKNFLESVKC